MKDAQRFLEHCATELFFRRFKSLAQLGHLPKQDDESAKAWLDGKLLVALLVEKLIGHALAVSPWGCRLAAHSSTQCLEGLQVHVEPGRAGR